MYDTVIWYKISKKQNKKSNKIFKKNQYLLNKSKWKCKSNIGWKNESEKEIKLQNLKFSLRLRFRFSYRKIATTTPGKIIFSLHFKTLRFCTPRMGWFRLYQK